MAWSPLRRSVARTTLLGVAALAVLLWGAVTQLGLDLNSLLAQLLLLLAALLVVVGLAAICGLVVTLIRRRR